MRASCKGPAAASEREKERRNFVEYSGLRNPSTANIPAQFN